MTSYKTTWMVRFLIYHVSGSVDPVHREIAIRLYIAFDDVLYYQGSSVGPVPGISVFPLHLFNPA